MSDNNMFDELFTIQKLTREQAEAVRKEPTSVFGREILYLLRAVPTIMC